MRKNGLLSLTALLAFALGTTAAAQVQMTPVRVKAAPVVVGAAGAAGGAVNVRALSPLLFNPSVLPTLPALESPSVKAKINAMAVQYSPVKLLPKNVAHVDNVGVRQAAMTHENVPTFAASAVADAPVVEERPAETSENRKSEATTFEKDKLRQASEKLEKSEKGRGEIGSLNNIFDGDLHRRGTPAVRTEAERESIAAKTRAKRDYLAPVQDLSGRQLLGKLREISGRGYRTHSYKEARKELFSNTDNFKKNGVRGVVAAYSDIFVPGQGDDGSLYKERGDVNGDGYSGNDRMNVEHLWPQSYFNQRSPMRSDLHHLMATFAHPNASRSRYPFGEVPDAGAEYRNNAGAKLGDGYFEPPDGVKGRVARGMLYFYTRYHQQGILPNGISQRFWNSRIEMFLRWNREHPPDAFELRRNDLVEEYQGNRNPFIDDPALADRIGPEGFRHEDGSANHRIVQASVSDGGSGVYESYARASKSSRRNGKRHHRRKNRR